MHITINVPIDWMPSLGLASHHISNEAVAAAQVKDTLIRALMGHLDLPTIAAQRGNMDEGSAGQKRMTISLPGDATTVLSGVAKELGLTPGPSAKTILGMVRLGVISIAAKAQQGAPVDETHPLALLNRSFGRDARSEQVALYDAIWTSVSECKIGMVEGGTGIGKTLAMVAIAGRWVHEYQSNCAIACPTLALIRQFANEYRKHAAVTDMPELRVIVGKREYVSEDALREFLDVRGKQWDSEALREWLLRGLPGVIPEGTEGTAWQVSWMESLAPGLPIDEVILREGSSADDAGMQAYRSQFRRIHVDGSGKESPMEASILLCSHAMLAQDMRRKMRAAKGDETYTALALERRELFKALKGKRRVDAQELLEQVGVANEGMSERANAVAHDSGILPPFTCLLVDEGHQLEENFSNALSDSVSLVRLISNLWEFKELGGKISVEAIKKVQQQVDALIAKAGDADSREYYVVATAGPSVANALLEISAVCADIGSTRDTKSDRYRIGWQIKTDGRLLQIAAAQARSSSFIRHSPIRHFPQVFVGRQSVNDFLSQLWSLCTGAAIISATLYLQRAEGPSAAYSAMILGVPGDRLITHAPVNAHWATTPIQEVWLAQQSGNWLLPPDRKVASAAKDIQANYSDQEARWHEEVAVELQRIWETAAGGVLVLCTSYATVNALQTHLAGKYQKLDLVVASTGFTLEQQKKTFLEMSHAGKRLIWLAVGSAWTGLDIGGHTPWEKIFGEPLAPKKDNVLTDLVIPRLPFGTNRSMTHAWRCANRHNIPWEILDAAFRFKQALGRLVRVAGLARNRRIFVLDGRLSGQRSGRFAPFEHALAPYQPLNWWEPAS